MASKVHVQDNSIAERRLRPIYEWLDSGNNKKALQECEKVLKKTPNLHCARALKALALFRMNKETECINILESLNEEQVADSAALQAVTLCYRELQQLEKVCELYDRAIRLDPTNEELHTHLFMAYVRLGDFQMQQQTALGLYRLRPKTPYYCWAVMSVIQQATRGRGRCDQIQRNLLLALARRMMDKLIAEGRLDSHGKQEAEPEIQLYLLILDLQGDYESCLNIYEGPLASKLVCTSPLLGKIPYLVKLKRWAEVNVICKSVLIDNMDRWNIWREYIHSVFELMETNGGINNHVEIDSDLETVDDTPEKAHEFICRLVENGVDNGYHLRGPYLARFELLSMIFKCKLDCNDLLGEPIELFIEYFRKFGHKAACVADLRIYLHLLDDERKAELSSRLLKDVGISSTSVPQSESQMQRHICSLQLSRLCGSHRNLPADHLGALVTALSLHYQHGYQTYGRDLLSTDQGPADAYALLSAHVLYDLSQSGKSSRPLIDALTLLQNLLRNSPSCFVGKLLAVRLYHTLGAPLGAQRIYESLDVKHSQLDSLGWLHCARLATSGLYFLSSQLYDHTFNFFAVNYKDTSDYLTFSYKYGSFSKLEDFINFRETLNNSYHYALTTVDRVILHLIQLTSPDGVYHINFAPRDVEANWSCIRDNADLNVCSSWDPERANAPLEQIKEVNNLFEYNLHFLRLRTQMVDAIAAGVAVVKFGRNRPSCIDRLMCILNEWENCHRQIASFNFQPIAQNLVTLPLPSRLHIYLETPYIDILVPLLRFLTNDMPSSTKNIEEQIVLMIDRVCDVIREHMKQEDFDWNRREVMERVTNVIEVLSISSFICVLCNDLWRPQGKKSKKKTETTSKDLFVDLRNCLRDKTKEFDDCIETWKTSEGDVMQRIALLNIASEEQTNVFNDLESSHTMAIKEIRAVLKNKLKLLSGLGC